MLHSIFSTALPRREKQREGEGEGEREREGVD
jgi:hypothetical protein